MKHLLSERLWRMEFCNEKNKKQDYKNCNNTKRVNNHALHLNFETLSKPVISYIIYRKEDPNNG